MKKKRCYTNPKFPNTSIDIFYDDVYGGGMIHQYRDQKGTPQVLTLAKKALLTFVEEIEKEGWR